MNKFTNCYFYLNQKIYHGMLLCEHLKLLFAHNPLLSALKSQQQMRFVKCYVRSIASFCQQKSCSSRVGFGIQQLSIFSGLFKCSLQVVRHFSSSFCNCIIKHFHLLWWVNFGTWLYGKLLPGICFDEVEKRKRTMLKKGAN